MRGIKFILLVAVAIAGLTIGTGVGASTGDKSSAATRAVHVRDLVVQGRSTDRARMPARVQRLLKRANESPAFSCAGATTKVNTAAAQTCVWPDNYAGLVTCIQVSNSATVVQTCDATQTNATKNNNALIIQIIWAQHQSSPQDGTQIVKLRQTNGTGTNNAGVSQYIKQALGRGTPDDTDEGDFEPDAAATALAAQSQESHQTIHLRQITGNLLAPTAAAGSNNAALLQFLRQRERASHATTVQQSQNTDYRPTSCVPGSDETSLFMQNDANQCIISNQTSTTGKQNLLLNGDYNQFQRVRGATAGSQDQGVDSSGGGDYGLVQLSEGLSNVLTNQNERLVQRAINATAVFQDQNGPRKSQGSSQGTNPDDKWRGFQTSTEIQTSTGTSPSFKAAKASPGHQSDVLEYFGFSSGDIRASQTANMNGDVTNWGCPEPGTTQTGNNNSCAAVVHCEQGGVDSLHWSQVGSACQPVCPEGTVFNSETGQCESIFTTSTTCYPCLSRTKSAKRVLKARRP